MNTYQDNIIVNSCQYTPVYLVQDTGAIQEQCYTVAQSNADEAKPLTNNLKRFYENSGIFENNHGNNAPNVLKPRILKKQHSKSTGNNLKVANFFLPKSTDGNIQENNNLNKQYLTLNNIVIKPTVTPASVSNTVPKVEVDRKIVKLKNFPSAFKQSQEKILPKIKPKEQPPLANPMKHTSVQLLKLGETYHSLNQLSNEQMKMVNQALKIFDNPEKTKSLEPTYDPVTNTHFIYKVVSPKSISVVGKNKITTSNRKEGKKEYKKVQEQEMLKPDPVAMGEKIKKEIEEDPDPPIEVKVTRSGRKVKFPKQMVPERTLHKPKKKTGAIVSCFQCFTEFCSLYRLQKHYQYNPTHIPAKIHSNLFHCLLAIVKSGSEEDRSNIFIQQLELLVEKLKSLLPCLLLNEINGSESKSCTINDEIGRLLGLNPGKYNLNVDALTCVKDNDGNCKHNPSYTSNPSQINQNNPESKIPDQNSSTKQNNITSLSNDTEDCARVNAVDKWPTTHKRLWNNKQKQKQKIDAKKMRLLSESTESIIDMGIEDLVNFEHDEGAINVQPKSLTLLDNLDVSNENSIQSKFDESQSNTDILSDSNKPYLTNETYTQFHSTHFDIRSSPIKPSAAVFRRFQINPEKLAKYDEDIIRPIENKLTEITEKNTIPCADETSDLQNIFRDDLSIHLSPCKDTAGEICPELTFETSKNWIVIDDNYKSNENFKTDGLVEPSSLHVQETVTDNLSIGNLMDTNEQLGDNDSRLSSQSSSVLNFLESLGNECLSYPETEIRNNVTENIDFQLDLFSFNNA
ncbi:unnamed protein product [Diatraea saccharalis]|uniref:Uncharacterized protein n=1 Tax=Diatraea saccharalis TaxID=40085 RepID=A0A9N9R853_9NEOP|nr:unnamed protein product [Diatraea saccharalis]